MKNPREDRVDEEKRDALHAAIAEGVAEAERGELYDGPEVVEELREWLRRRRRKGETGRP